MEKKFQIFFIILTLALCDATLNTEEFIAEINAKATTWRARKNFDNLTFEQMKAMTGLIGIHSDPNFSLPVVVHDESDTIPDTFDAREKWPECESIGTIRFQGRCGSCWAFGAVEVMSDRLCISTAGKKKFTFSVEELVSCCTDCGFGCDGGFLLEPYQYWQNNGIPSGGDQGSDEGCRPYTSSITGVTPECNKQCVSGYSKQWSEDIRHGIAAYIVNNTVEQMQREILINGPISTFFVVYQDFYRYGSGIYRYVSGNLLGDHVVKIIGWGSENDQPYWLIANSWGRYWGEEGFFRMPRGENHCGIEVYVVAGSPNTTE